MDRFVGGNKYCNNCMRSLCLNYRIEEADILKQVAGILKVAKADAAGVCFKIIVNVKDMREGLRDFIILVPKQEAQLEACKLWWNSL
jgi:hypothetical protein